jgi:hypothetical protein
MAILPLSIAELVTVSSKWLEYTIRSHRKRTFDWQLVRLAGEVYVEGVAGRFEHAKIDELN